MSAQPPYRPPTSPPPGYPPPPPRRGGRGWIFAVAFVALVIIGGVGYWFGGRDTNASSSAPDTTAAPATTAAAPSASAPATSAATSAAVTSAAVTSAAATSAAPTTSTTASTPSPTVTPTPTTTTPPSHPDPDFGYVTSVIGSGATSKITFDRATLLTGAAAASAATAHGQTVEDDYFIVNDNPLIRTFSLSPALVVSGSTDLSGELGPKPSTLAAVVAWLTANPGNKLPVDLSYDDKTGAVTKIAEVFFP